MTAFNYEIIKQQESRNALLQILIFFLFFLFSLLKVLRQHFLAHFLVILAQYIVNSSDLKREANRKVSNANMLIANRNCTKITPFESIKLVHRSNKISFCTFKIFSNDLLDSREFLIYILANTKNEAQKKTKLTDTSY